MFSIHQEVKDTVGFGLCTVVSYWLGFPILVWGILLFASIASLYADFYNHVIPLPDIIYDNIFKNGSLGLNTYTAPYIVLGCYLLVILIWLYS